MGCATRKRAMSQKLSKRQLLSKGTKSLIDKSKLQTRRGRPKVKCDWCKTDCIEHKTSFVENDKVSDEQAVLLSRDVARKIEDEATYPGQVRVCVVRETRSTEYAR